MNLVLTHKKCRGCDKLLSVEHFQKKSSEKDGLQRKCKKCREIEGKKYRVKANKTRKIRRNKGKPIKVKKPLYMRHNVYSPDWNVIRKIIYKRDNWTCQECGIKCHNSTKHKIQCHHIDYDTTNNNAENLITLCASCHMKTNFKRKDWTQYFLKRKET